MFLSVVYLSVCWEFLGGNIVCLFVNRDHTDSHFCETVLPETSTDWKSQSGDDASPCVTVTHQPIGSVVQYTPITQRQQLVFPHSHALPGGRFYSPSFFLLLLLILNISLTSCTKTTYLNL